MSLSGRFGQKWRQLCMVNISKMGEGDEAVVAAFNVMKGLGMQCELGLDFKELYAARTVELGKLGITVQETKQCKAKQQCKKEKQC